MLPIWAILISAIFYNKQRHHHVRILPLFCVKIVDFHIAIISTNISDILIANIMAVSRTDFLYGNMHIAIFYHQIHVAQHTNIKYRPYL